MANDVTTDLPDRNFLTRIALAPSSDFSQFKHICFIDSTIEYFSDYLNSETYPVVYDYNSDRESLKTGLLERFNQNQIERISFVFHGPADNSFTPKPFINNEPYFGGENENLPFLQELFDILHVQHVDFLGCNLLQVQEWKDYFASFQNVVVGASIDNTGNMKYGGDWVMENTMENVRDLYFNGSIENFATVLTVYSHSGTPNLKFTINAGGTTATITESYNLTGAVTIPTTVTQGSTSYTVTAIGDDAFTYARFGSTNGAQITSIIIPNSVTIIRGHAFYKCNVLTSVTFSNTLTHIGYNSFHLCTALLAVSIPGSVTTIAGYAFHLCTSLRSVTFANTSNISILLEGTFTRCGLLSGVILPTSIVNITSAFDTIDDLTTSKTKTVISYYGLHYAITDVGTLNGITFGNTLSMDADKQTQTITIRTSTINPTTDKLTFTVKKNYDSYYRSDIWPNGIYGTSRNGTWDLSSNGTEGDGIAGTRITGTLTLTYTPSKTSSYRDTDYCFISLKRPPSGGGGYEGTGTYGSFTVYAKVLYNFPTNLDSRLTALNGRAMFNINVKEEGDTSTLVQLFTSTLGGITSQTGPHYIQDCRFNQTYLFGPANDTPCDIKIDTTSFSTTGPWYGTAKSSMRATVFLAYSDYRLKHNVETLNKTHTVDDIRVVKYTSDDNTQHFGVIAHELAEVYPELVKGEKDEKMLQSVSYIELIPLLINEVQTIKKELITLNKENEQLAEKIEQLEYDENFKKTA